MRVGGLDGAPRGGVARLGLGGLVLGGPRGGVGELVFERAQRGLGVFDCALRLLLVAQAILRGALRLGFLFWGRRGVGGSVTGARLRLGARSGAVFGGWGVG